MDFAAAWEFYQTAGPPGLLFAFVAALYFRMVRWGKDYADLEKEKAKWEAEVERLRRNNDRLLYSALKNAGMANILLQSSEELRGQE